MHVTPGISDIAKMAFGATMFMNLLMCEARAQTSPVVVELYTSQGCAACPPADLVLEQLAGRDDVIALGLHVDYWDYIGWADSFGQAAFSQRQKYYAQRNGRASIYTPQMIVGGLDEVKGSAQMRVMTLIHEHLSAASSDLAPIITLQQADSTALRLHAEAPEPFETRADVQLVRYIDSASVAIDGGENEGLYVTYHNIVTSWEVIGQWDGMQPFQRNLDISDSGPVVVIIQEQGQGPILAAARRR